MKKTVISANCVVGMAVLCLPVFLLFVTDTFAAVCLRLIAGLKPHNLLGSQPALQCAVRFTIQVQNLTIKYQNTAYLEKIVDFILLFCYIETTSQAGIAARYLAANPPTQAYKRHEPSIRKHARGKGKPTEAMPSTYQEKEPETQ